MPDAERSRAARTASEAALVRVVHHYGQRPEFVVLGGLVPELLCAGSAWCHAGTTDVDVQVDLEISCGSINTARLEEALKNSEFEPEGTRLWRWVADTPPTRTVVKFELLADLDDQPNQAEIAFDACEHLGAVNLRGTGFAARDVEVRTLTAKVGDDLRTVEVNVTGLAGFLLAKAAAATADASPRTGTTSCSSCSTTTAAVPWKQPTRFWPRSPPISSDRFARCSTTCWPTSPIPETRARTRTQRRCTSTGGRIRRSSATRRRREGSTSRSEPRSLGRFGKVRRPSKPSR